MARRNLTTEEFIIKAIGKHGLIYQYTKVEYERSNEKVLITCSLHGDFSQSARNHLQGKGCPKCKGVSTGDRLRSNTEDFINKAVVVHNNIYEYNKVHYINNTTPIIITCLQHKGFLQSPNNHLQGQGCPKCKESKGEKTIRRYLELNCIYFEQEKRFDDCRDKNPLPFDFYIPSENTLIEFQGRQHYVMVDFFGGQKGFDKQQKHDGIKRDYCKLKGVRLLEIPFTSVNKIDIILIKHFKNKL